MTREDYEYRAFIYDYSAFKVCDDLFEVINELKQYITELEVQLADANSYFDGIRTELLANKIKES